jgi:hypothetical protein
MNVLNISDWWATCCNRSDKSPARRTNYNVDFTSTKSLTSLEAEWVVTTAQPPANTKLLQRIQSTGSNMRRIGSGSSIRTITPQPANSAPQSRISTPDSQAMLIKPDFTGARGGGSGNSTPSLAPPTNGNSAAASPSIVRIGSSNGLFIERDISGKNLMVSSPAVSYDGDFIYPKNTEGVMPAPER